MLVVLGTPNRAVNVSVVRDLAESGFAEIGASTRAETIRAAFESEPDAVVIDLRMDDGKGLEVIRVIRAASDVPILALGPANQLEETVAALESGADDVMPYTIERVELGARLRVALRRRARLLGAQAEEQTVITTGDLVIDRQARTVTKRGEPVRLSRYEYRLLDALASRVGQVAPHRYLLSLVWGAEAAGNLHYLRLYMSYLRKKLEDRPSRPEYILTEWGVGYRLAARPAAHIAAGQEPRPDAEGDEPTDGGDASPAD